MAIFKLSIENYIPFPRVDKHTSISDYSFPHTCPGDIKEKGCSGLCLNLLGWLQTPNFLYVQTSDTKETL